MTEQATGSASPPAHLPLGDAALEQLTAETDQLLERWEIGGAAPEGTAADSAAVDGELAARE